MTDSSSARVSIAVPVVDGELVLDDNLRKVMKALLNGSSEATISGVYAFDVADRQAQE